MKNNATLEELQGYKREYDKNRTQYEMAKQGIENEEKKLRDMGIDPRKLDEEIAKLKSLEIKRKEKLNNLMKGIRKDVAGI